MSLWSGGEGSKSRSSTEVSVESSECGRAEMGGSDVIVEIRSGCVCCLVAVVLNAWNPLYAYVQGRCCLVVKVLCVEEPARG